MAFANTIYLSHEETDVYQFMYDEVKRLNGDYEPIPETIETYYAQEVDLRDSEGFLKDSFLIIHLGKDKKRFSISDSLSSYPYLNYLLVKCWLRCAIANTPATLNHLQYGLADIGHVVFSEKAFSQEKVFIRELGAYLSSLLLQNVNNQHVVTAIRLFVNFGIEHDYWGFSEELLFTLSEVSVSSNNQKARVSLLDHERGPFTRSEVADITVAIEDKLDLNDRLLVKLAMRFGLRPIQLALLREEDFFYDEKKLSWYLNIPRVKGKQALLRRNKNNFVLRELDEELAAEINSSIELEQTQSHYDSKGKSLPRPLFKRRSLDQDYLNSSVLEDYSWHLSSHDVSSKFYSLAETLSIPSRYLTDDDGNPQVLKMNCYRFRYTLGTRMVMEGKAPEEVAIALDHSTTASVQHYFRYNRDLIDFIDDSFQSSASLKNAVARWQGFLIDEHDETIQGSIIRVSEIASLGKCLKSTKCEFHPTVSCYGCSRFRPFKDADHEKQLEIIKGERDFVIAHSSGPVQSQLDEAYEGALHIVEAQKTLREGRNV